MQDIAIVAMEGE